MHSFPIYRQRKTDTKTRYLDSEVKCHYSFLQENLMDMNHQFLHRGIMSRINTTFLGLREGDDWVEVDYTFKRVGKQPIGRKSCWVSAQNPPMIGPRIS
ncbi:MAG: hypothetical protein Q8K59_12375 [Nitrosomonas sp.]|nr:hypothetical protein [Nitrosomonas sp.]MDP1951861.1 hypothetical protein [Nitrosomonas sp.]